MRIRRTATALALSAAAVTGVAVAAAPPASAHVYCDPNPAYRVTKHAAVFLQVDSVQLVNKRSRTATLTAVVGEAHTSSRSYSGTITASVEGGFWVFAKATASASASKTIETSTTMSRQYSATAQVPGHSTRTVLFGFRRYNQYIQQYYLVNTSMTTCGIRVLHAGWVRAPYQKAFIIQ